jgi:membrane-bound lytic murein transglycosylase D
MDIRAALGVAIFAGLILGLSAADQKLSSPAEASTAVAAAVPIETSDIVQWDLPVVRNESVLKFVDLFESRQTDRIALYLKRSGRYEGMIRAKLRERGMPEDLLYLSMIESGFNPNARSAAQAVGLWQFVAGTARMYGLRVDGYVDERRDPERATDAALEYLNDLHSVFGAWNLAAAAYNSGEYRVARAMKDVTGSVRGSESDFWRIRGRLPSETREYVPLMFAMALMGKEPHKYGLDEVERLLPVQVEYVPVPPATSLDDVAGLVGMSPEDLRELNAHLVRGVTPPDEAYPVKVPLGRGDALRASFGGVRGFGPVPLA